MEFRAKNEMLLKWWHTFNGRTRQENNFNKIKIIYFQLYCKSTENIEMHFAIINKLKSLNEYKSGLNMTSTSFTSNPPTKQLELVIHMKWNDSAYLFIHSLDVCFAGLWWTVALFTDVSSLNCRRRTYSFHAARKARSVRRVLPPRSPRCRSDCRHHSSLSKLRKGDSCAREFGEQKKKRTRRP